MIGAQNETVVPPLLRTADAGVPEGRSRIRTNCLL